MSKLLAKLIAMLFVASVYVTMNMNKDYDINTDLDNIWLWGKE